MPDSPTVVERVLQHPRSSLLVVLVAVPLACWVWVAVMARDMYGPMTGAAAWMMRLEWDTPRLILLWAMWAAMMFAVTLPAAAPIVLPYARAGEECVQALSHVRDIVIQVVIQKSVEGGTCASMS